MVFIAKNADPSLVMAIHVQWNLSIKDTRNRGHLSNEDTACCPNHIEMCANLPLSSGHLSIQDSQLGPSGVHCSEMTIYMYGAIRH